MALACVFWNCFILRLAGFCFVEVARNHQLIRDDLTSSAKMKARAHEGGRSKSSTREGHGQTCARFVAPDVDWALHEKATLEDV